MSSIKTLVLEKVFCQIHNIQYIYFVLLKTSQICRKSRVFPENILALDQVRRKENILSWSGGASQVDISLHSWLKQVKIVVEMVEPEELEQVEEMEVVDTLREEWLDRVRRKHGCYARTWSRR